MKNKNNSTKIQHKNELGKIDPTVAGIDIGSRLIHVAIPDGEGGAKVKEYFTHTPDLHKIAADLKRAGVKTAVMEATGVYWVPLYEVLETFDLGIKPILVDAKSVKNVPGRKTDVLDCQWIQTLYSAGLLRAAFRTPKSHLTLREYCRTRKWIVKGKQIALLHMEKALQLMNIKLSTAVSDIAGITGMNIIRAIVAGERSPKVLVSFRNKRCKQPKEEFVAALTGNYQTEHLHALKLALEQYDFSHGQLLRLDELILEELEKLPDLVQDPVPLSDKDKKAKATYASFNKPRKNNLNFDAREVLWRKSRIDLTALPGISDLSALTVFAELGGYNVDSWRSVKEFSSWLKLSPGNNISGGKRRRSRYMPSEHPITLTLRLAAVSCKRSKTSIGAFIRKLCGRTDKPKGIKAGAHKLSRLIYFMCAYGTQYVERGEAYAEKKYQERRLKNLKRQAANLGFELTPSEQAA